MSENVNADRDGDQENQEQELCTQCLTGNRPDSHFCRQCGAPLSSYAATGPFESLFAEGHVYRKAAEQPQRLIVVLGMWLIFGIMALAGVMIAVIGWGMGNGFGVLAGIGLLAVSLFLIGKTTRNYRNRQATKTEDDESRKAP